MLKHPMTPTERRATVYLASIFAFRMLGLFMILPVFSIYAHQLDGATPLLIGLALGVYGLTQGLLQMPLGMLSDFVGRRPVITAGLLVFSLGSIIAALSHSIHGVIIGRALQGAGAIGSTIMALVSDITREEQRTKAMAILGITIGFSFALAMLLGPIINTWVHVSGIFWLTAVLGGLGILILYIVPTTAAHPLHPETEPEANQLLNMLKKPELLHLDFGIFALHAMLTASFIALPISLVNAGLLEKQQWLIYLPVLLGAFLLALPLIGLTEAKRLLRPGFLVAISLLALAELLFWFAHAHVVIAALGLLIFFTAFTYLEACLPSLVSKTAPRARKGTALGIYSSCQFLGIFVGGTFGGLLYSACGLLSIYLFCFILAVLWLGIASLSVSQPPTRK